MTTQNIGLLNGLNSKMGYLNQRQRVISQNIANADTPGYKPKDLVKVDFGDVMEKVYHADRKRVSMDMTDSGHMPPPDSSKYPPKSREQRKTYEVAPVGNAVVMEEQLIQAGQTVMDYNLMTSLYQKNIGMIKTAIGRGN